MGTQRTYSVADCHEAIRRVAREQGTPLTAELYASHRSAGMPSIPAIRKRCGTWNEALRGAGLDAPHLYRESRFAQEDLIAWLQDVARVHGEPVTYRTYLEHRPNGAPSATTFIRVFGSWKQAVEAAGVQASGRALAKHLPLESLRDAVLRASWDGVIPSQAEYGRRKRPGDPEADVIVRRFGSWEAAADACGVQRCLPQEQRGMASMLLALQAVAEGGVMPTRGRYDKQRESGMPASAAIVKRFDTWEAAAQRAGLRYIGDDHVRGGSFEQMRRAVRRIAPHGVMPTMREYEQRRTVDEPKMWTIYRRLGGWEAAAEALGMRWMVDTDEAFDMETLKGVVERIAHDQMMPRWDEYEARRADGEPSVWAVVQHFGGWEQAASFLDRELPGA